MHYPPAPDAQLRQRYDETLARLVENSPFGVYLVDADFRLALVSAGARRVFAAIDPLIGRDFAEILRTVWTEPFATQALDLFRHTLATGEPYHSANTVERRQNIDAVESYDWQLERVPLPDGRAGVVCHFYDATERLQAQSALRRSEQHYRALSAATADVSYRMSADWSLMLPLDGRALVPSTDHPLGDWAWLRVNLPADEHPRVRAAIAHAIATKSLFELEHRVNRPDGTTGWTLSRAVPILDDAGHIAEWFGAASDITARKRAEAALLAAKEAAESANRAKDQFLAALSHELRTPLTPVLATFGGWERSPDFPTTLHDELRMLRRNVELEARLIDDLLDVTRIANGKIVLHAETLNVNDLVRSVLAMYQSESDAKQTTVHADLAATSGCFVHADPGRLQQAFWNVLKNAVKFTPPGGRIDVATRDAPDDRVEILVRDTRVGIPTDRLQQIFAPFTQGDPETVRRYGGLGLGLAITQTLLRAQRGDVTAHSQGPGTGSTFTISLPCAPAPHRTISPSPQPPPPSSSTTPLRILLVEDHADTARVLARLLRSTGHTVTLASSVADALASAGSTPFDLLVSDIGLPDGTGLDLIRQLRLRHPHPFPALALTGYGMDDDIARTRAAGFNDHLTKPINFQKLESTLQRLAHLTP